MFFLWLVFTSNLNSQTIWLKVKLKLVNLYHFIFIELIFITACFLAKEDQPQTIQL